MFRMTWGGGHVHDPGLRAAALSSRCEISIGIREREVLSGDIICHSLGIWPTNMLPPIEENSLPAR
jgi:hypothetical protein